MTDIALFTQHLGQLGGTWSLDPTHTSVEFAVRHMMVATVKGRVQPRRGELHVDENDLLLSWVDVELDVASIDTGDRDRDAHLRSPDFLDVERFPVMRYRSTGVSEREEGRYRVRGELTVKDVTREVELDAELGGVVQDPFGNNRVGFSATAEVNRSDFGLTWNAMLESGGVVVGDKVRIAIEAEFTKPL